LCTWIQHDKIKFKKKSKPINLRLFFQKRHQDTRDLLSSIEKKNAQINRCFI
jgi:hypothetical protein